MHSSDPPRRGRGGFAPPGHHGSGSTPRATLSIDISLRCGFASPRMLIGSGVLRGRNVQRIPRKVVPWAAVALVTAMVAGGAALGVVTAPSSTTTAVRSLASPPPGPTATTTFPTITTTTARPSLLGPPTPGPITVNASAWRGHGNLALISSGQLEILSNTGTLSGITGPTGGGFDSDAAWSPDDHWLAFLHTGPANGYDLPAPTLWLLVTGATRAQEVTTSGIAMFEWSPTAPVLAYSVVPKYNFPAGVPEDVWFDGPGAPPTSVAVGTGAGLGSIAWSPDGSELAFDDSVFPQPASATSPATPATGRLGIVSFDGDHVVTVYRVSQSGIDLAGWWPEGGGLLFWEDPGFAESADGDTLYSLELDTARPVALATSLVGPTWLAAEPDGPTVAVVAGRRPNHLDHRTRCRPVQFPRCYLPSGGHPDEHGGPGPQLVCIWQAHFRGGIRQFRWWGDYSSVRWPSGTPRMPCGRWFSADSPVPWHLHLLARCWLYRPPRAARWSWWRTTPCGWPTSQRERPRRRWPGRCTPPLTPWASTVRSTGRARSPGRLRPVFVWDLSDDRLGSLPSGSAASVGAFTASGTHPGLSQSRSMTARRHRRKWGVQAR